MIEIGHNLAELLEFIVFATAVVGVFWAIAYGTRQRQD